MSSYRKWLGIRDERPDHYRLLGVDKFEPDPDVISNAADRQMTYLRTLRNPEAEKLLNEIATARICLLDPLKKNEYDRSLLDPPGKCKDDPVLAEIVPEPPGACSDDPVLADVVAECLEQDKIDKIHPELRQRWKNESRVWTDVTGGFAVRALYGGYNKDELTVSLIGRDGSVSAIPFQELSTNDQKEVTRRLRDHLKKRAKRS